MSLIKPDSIELQFGQLQWSDRGDTEDSTLYDNFTQLSVSVC